MGRMEDGFQVIDLHGIALSLGVAGDHQAMAAQSERISAERDGNVLTLRFRGDWSVSTAADTDRELRRLGAVKDGIARIDVSGVERLDTAGAWLIDRTRRQLEAGGASVTIDGASADHDILLERMTGLVREAPPEPPRYSRLSRLLHGTGVVAAETVAEIVDLVGFLGAATVAAARATVDPRRIRFTSFVSHLERTGLNAIPIVGLLSFVIGIVLAYQGAGQLRRFGAEIFTINLLGISMLREMGILMTAIIIAGRSGSAFTAQIGTMQVNEEIDAMRTIGLDPIEVLVLPRTFALVIALPLLVVFSDIMGLLGGMLIAVTVLDINATQFLERLRDAVPIWSFWVGMIKAPVFGFVIALIGCREGLKVGGSAESVGRQTTRSVVVSIFMVMILDAVFAIFFSTVGV